ncbi:MAG TPA: DUF3421 domain-containing protein, partial [Chitinophagales bacterium]|nr:DUF3421 domain-containing protein [Chitinophagales bacterium]
IYTLLRIYLPPFCYTLMVLGRGTNINISKGLKTLEEVCNNKYEDACAYLVSYYLEKSDCKQAESYLKKLSPTSNKSLQSKYNEKCKGEISPWKPKKISPRINPQIQEATACNTTGCNNAQAPKWVTFNGSIPADAISGGVDAGQTIYVCRCNYIDGKHSGKVVGGKCLIGWGGKEIAVGSFEILTGAKGCSYVWAPWNGSIPSNALIAGYTNYAKTVYVVKGRYNNADVIGKLLKGQTTAFFGYGGVEQVIAPTHILVSCVSSYKPQLYSYDCPRVDCAGTIVKWETFKGSVSTKSVIGGVENNKKMEICRCDYQNGKHAGKVVAGKCNIGYGGTEVAVSTFEVLEGTLGCNLHWVRWTGKIPDNALVAGTVEENGKHNMYVIKTKIGNSEHCGKLREGWDKGIVGYGGKEELLTPTHILVQCGQ